MTCDWSCSCPCAQTITWQYSHLHSHWLSAALLGCFFDDLALLSYKYLALGSSLPHLSSAGLAQWLPVISYHFQHIQLHKTHNKYPNTQSALQPVLWLVWIIPWALDPLQPSSINLCIFISLRLLSSILYKAIKSWFWHWTCDFGSSHMIGTSKGQRHNPAAIWVIPNHTRLKSGSKFTDSVKSQKSQTQPTNNLFAATYPAGFRYPWFSLHGAHQRGNTKLSKAESAFWHCNCSATHQHTAHLFAFKFEH